MPKTIVVDLREPDMSKSQNLALIVDERVLDEIRFQISDKSGILWGHVLSPQDDFSIPSKDIETLHREVSELLANLNILKEKLSHSSIILLYTLDGLCNACTQTGDSLFGYAD
jgi:hypothetical protein